MKMAMSEVLIKKPPTKGRWYQTNQGLIIIVLAVCCFSLAGYLYYIQYLQEKDQPGTEYVDEIRFVDDFCQGKECLLAATKILSSIDESIDPCGDFYEFSCKNFIRHAYETNTPSPLYTQRESQRMKLDAMIATPIKGDEWRPQLLQKQFYRSCMDTLAIDLGGNARLLSVLDDLGGFPVLLGQDWLFEDVELYETLLMSKDLGLPFQWFFKISPSTSRKHQIEVGVPDFLMPFDGPFKESTYESLMIETVVALGGARGIAESEMDKVLFFEENLYLIFGSYQNRSASVTKKLKEIQLVFANYDLASLIQELVGDLVPISENTTLFINEDFLKDLNLLLAGTAKRTYINYFIWKIIQEFGVHMTSPIREYFGNFSNFLNGKNPVITRSDVCLGEAKKRFPKIAEISYMKHLLTNETSKNVRELVSNIQDTFKDRIRNAEWMEKEVKDRVSEKLNHVTTFLSAHSLDFDKVKLEKFLNIGNLNFTTGNFIDMLREKNINDFNMTFLLRNVTVDETRELLFQSAFDTDSLYLQDLNILEISTAFLHDEFFSNDRPNYLNYGALGVMIARELARGLSLQALSAGLDFESFYVEDKSNTTADSSGWTNETLDQFLVRFRCINEQYSIFELQDTGEDLFEKNFADTLGIDVAYEAYNAWRQLNRKEEDPLPGLAYDANQLFWMQYATDLCYEKLDTNSFDLPEVKHPRWRDRVLLPLKHSRYFPKDFKCMPGSRMNPVQKCSTF